MKNKKFLNPYTDAPIRTLADDQFGIRHYVTALCSFIRSSETPMTIAVQGEWGCGKSSFLSLIEDELCNPSLPPEEYFAPIHVNAWEMFLEDTYDNAVQDLTKNIIGQMAEHFEKLQTKNRSEKQKKAAGEALELFGKLMLNVANIDTGLVDQAKDLVSGLRKNEAAITTAQHKRLLENVILKDDSCQAFLIFIDDLDRLMPTMAVTLMEAVKILFDIGKCIFIMAVDYEVIANGIALKYGRDTVSSRDIARDFFEKLVQLPFQVPMANYRIRGYLQRQLRAIHFFSNRRDYVDYIDQVEEIMTLATKKNPRKMKSILNMFQAMDLLDERANDNAAFQMMELLLIVFQKSYPKVYEMLAERQSLNHWETTDTEGAIPPHDIQAYGLNSAWKRKIYLTFRENDQLRRNFYRIFRLLEMYEKYQNECIQSSEQYDMLFGLLNLIVGHEVNIPSSHYIGEEYDRHSGIQTEQGNALIRRIGDFSAFRSALDVGCGNGAITLQLWQCNPEMKVFAIDNSRSQLDVALKRYLKAREKMSPEPEGEIEFFYEDANKLSGSRQYDLVFSNAAMHWVGSAGYRVLYESLKPGGLLAVHQGGAGTYGELHEAAREAIRRLHLEDRYEGWHFPAYYPEEEEMEALLERTGFCDIEVETDASLRPADESLVEAFIAASLNSYSERVSAEEYEKIKETFRGICREKPFSVQVIRLYVMAGKQ